MKSKGNCECVVPESIHTPTPSPPSHRGSLEIPRGRRLLSQKKAKLLEEKYIAILEFLGGGGGVRGCKF